MIFFYSSDNPLLFGITLAVFFLSTAAPGLGLSLYHAMLFLAGCLGALLGWLVVVWVMDGIPPTHYIPVLLRQATRLLHRALNWLGLADGASRGGPTVPQRSRAMDADAVRQISTRVLEMPTEEWVPLEALATLSVHDIKERLRVRNVESRGCTEKHELLDLLRTHHTSTESVCSICFEEYSPGDCVRLLPSCKHVFHLECIDRWAYSAAAKSRTAEGRLKQPACPLCNTPL